MKIIGRETQKKIDLQIENLQKKVAELESQLSAAKAEHKKLDTAATKAQADSNKAQVESAKALAEAKTQLDAKAKELTAKAAELVAVQTAAKSEATSAKSQLDASAKQLSEATQENELLLSQLMQVQEELEKIFLDKKQLEATSAKAQADAKEQAEKLQQTTKQFEAEVAKLNASLATANSELTKLKQDLAQANQNIAQANQNVANEQKSKQAAEAALAELKAKSPAELKAVTDKYQQQAQAAQALEADLAKHKAELDQAHQALASAKAEAANTQQAKLELDTLQARTLSELEQLKKESAQLADQHAAKVKDSAQENELLLTQLMQVQEELESYYLDKTKFEKLYQDIQARWARLEKRYPNYVDFGSVELVAFDNLSDVPSVTWRVKDYAQGGMAFDEFLFQTVLQDGQPGIGLVLDAKVLASVDSALVPKLLKPQSKQLERFVRMGQTEFLKLMAATTIVTQLEASGWRGVELPKDFDLGFWRESLKLLPTQLQALPVMLRYDAIKLKRELTNPDYEHLWLEFKGMGLGARTWPKFEIRLGAAMVQRGGFSQFPKFEIPLIDGKTKPFESWYAESQDDNGAKLELRFSLEKQVFDTSVWAKLDDVDKALLLRLIYAMPDVLLRLEAEHASIHRPWATWVGFAKAAMQVIEAGRAAAQTKELPAPDAKAANKPKGKTLAASATPAKLPAPSAKSAVTKKASVAKPAAKVTAKAKTKPVAKKVAKVAPTTAKKTAVVKKAVAVKKVVPVKKPMATKKAMPVKKATAAKTAAAKKKPARKK